MADKRIQDLTPASSVGTSDRFVLEQSGQAKSLTGQILINDLAAALDGHGGISNVSYTPPVSPSLDGTLTITMADGTTNDVTITNGNGIESIEVAYSISPQGTTPGSDWYSSPVPPTDTDPFQWTRIRITDKTNTVVDAYSVSVKAVNPTISIGSVVAEPGATADATVTNSGTSYSPVFDFDFTLPKGDKGDTGDYIDPVAYFGTSTSAATEPTTWYSSPSSLPYTAGNFIWQKTEYTLHDEQTVQSTEIKVIGYIGQNGSGSGTVTQITFNGEVFPDDGTGNVTMNIDPEDVGAIADPSTKSNGQVLTYDSSADEWVAANPTTGNVNTVNNKGVDAGTTNITLYGTDIKVSSSDNTSVTAAIPQASSTTPAALGTAAVGTGTTWARADHVHKMPSAADVGALTSDDVQFKVYDSVSDIGLTSGSATIAGIWNALPECSILCVQAGQLANSDKPNNYGMLEVIKRLSSRGKIQFHGAQETNGDWQMFLNSSNVPTGVWMPMMGVIYKDFSVALAANSYVAPFTAFKSTVFAAGDIPSGCTPVSAIVAAGATSANVCVVQLNSTTGFYTYGRAEATVTVRIGFAYV